MQYRPPSSFPRLSRRAVTFLAAAIILFLLTLQLKQTEKITQWTRTGNFIKQSDHPIDELVTQAHTQFEQLLNKTAQGTSTVAEAYRTRRGRHPPPEFDKWISFAEENDAVIVEDFFDGIYDDLEPFWSVSPSRIRTLAASWPNLISIRNHAVKIKHGSENKLQRRVELLRQLQGVLPDVDIAFSTDAEQAIIVPWEYIQKALTSAAKTKPNPLPPPASVPFKSYSKRAELPRPTNQDRKKWNDLWLSKTPYWDMARRACAPGSPARNTAQDKDFSILPSFSQQVPYKSYEGFVSNWTAAKSPCVHPELRNLHGALVGTTNDRRHETLFPLFADSKIQDVNNVIVFPSDYYWGDEKYGLQSTDPTSWSDKKETLIWRGEATGGFHNKRNWKRFQRHRFVAMANGSWVSAVEAQPRANSVIPLPVSTGPPELFPLPLNTTWSISAIEQIPSTLGEWIESFTDVGFTHFHCNPATGLATSNQPETCLYVEPHYRIKERMDMSAQLAGKYVPDLDSDGVSPRFLKYLKSNSVPIKATIFSEWHDSRLVPWKHFVPMDNTYADWFGIMEYFLGYKGGNSRSDSKEGHDHVARAIAEQGSQWAGRVLRQEDVLVYVYRLILEYARVVDDRRNWMGYVQDLL